MYANQENRRLNTKENKRIFAEKAIEQVKKYCYKSEPIYGDFNFTYYDNDIKWCITIHSKTKRIHVSCDNFEFMYDHAIIKNRRNIRKESIYGECDVLLNNSACPIVINNWGVDVWKARNWST
jgi:hypothetical protein